MNFHKEIQPELVELEKINPSLKEALEVILVGEGIQELHVAVKAISLYKKTKSKLLEVCGRILLQIYAYDTIVGIKNFDPTMCSSLEEIVIPVEKANLNEVSQYLDLNSEDQEEINTVLNSIENTVSLIQIMKYENIKLD